MRRLILLTLALLLFFAGHAGAYTRGRVYIHSQLESDTDEGAALQQTLLGNLGGKLVRHYTCLDVLDSLGFKEMIGFIRAQQLIGVDDAKVGTEMDGIEGMMDMRYLILVNVTVMKDTNFYKFNVIAKNKKKAGFPFYTDSTIYRSYAAALAAIDNVTEELIKGFTKYLSDERESVGGEICAMKGPVTVTVETERTEEPPDETLYKYCNGGDHLWKKSAYLKATNKETWKLDRYGIPDTRGTMEGLYHEEAAVEEIDGCHGCSNSGRRAEWHYSKKSEATRTVSGLSDKSAGENSDNRDATVKLHFQDDGTYNLTVAATSAKGKMLSMSEESAEGSCDVMHKKQPGLTSTFTRPLEYTFGGFRGTPYDTRLKDTKTLVFEDKEKGEKTTVTVDFDLSRPTINK